MRGRFLRSTIDPSDTRHMLTYGTSGRMPAGTNELKGMLANGSVPRFASGCSFSQYGSCGLAAFAIQGARRWPKRRASPNSAVALPALPILSSSQRDTACVRTCNQSVGVLAESSQFLGGGLFSRYICRVHGAEVSSEVLKAKVLGPWFLQELPKGGRGRGEGSEFSRSRRLWFEFLPLSSLGSAENER